MPKKTMPFGAGDIASDNSLAAKYLDCLAKDPSPSIASAAAALERQLAEFSVKLLAFIADNGNCSRQIPIIDEEIELHNATTRLDRIRDSIDRTDNDGLNTGIMPIPENEVKNLGIF